MNYKKPSKERANEDFLRRNGILSKAEVYNIDLVEQKKLFLIICEGKNTEPLYFESFPVPSKTVIIEGGCNSKTALVNYALIQKGKDVNSGREIWCVFDFDIKPDEAATQPADFNNAIKRAEENGLKIAWSNDAFELWFLLHYHDLNNTRLTRHEMYPKLREKWGGTSVEGFDKIAKSEAFCKDHFDRHGGAKSEMQKHAIRRARKLHEQYDGRMDYANHCPCTTVYLLVEELNKNLKP